MIELRIERVEFLEKGYRVHWDVDDDQNLFRVSPLEILYEFTSSHNTFYPINNLLAFTLPILAKEYGDVRIVSEFNWDGSIKNYWKHVLGALKIENFHLYFENNNLSDTPILNSSKESPSQGRMALLFGGGIESMFALSVLYPYKPVLLSIIGERWMNNDIQKYSIKQQLEDKLISNFDLNFQRIVSNAFSLINKPDLYKNHYVTGLLFYWHSLPVCREFDVYTIYESIELEYALSFEKHDLSLCPTFLRNIIFEHEPLFLPLFACYPKIQMLAELAKTPFINYIYSCFHNMDKRWCGKCSKCYRISEYCERLNIDKNIIGMQEGIVGLRETSALAKHYWELPDQLYGKRRFREFLHAIAVYSERAKQYVLSVMLKVARRFFGSRVDYLIDIFRSKVRRGSKTN